MADIYDAGLEMDLGTVALIVEGGGVLDDSVVSFDAMNSSVEAYLNNVHYDAENYGVSQMAGSQYLPAVGDYTKEDPVGYPLSLPENGTLYIVDETDPSVHVQSYKVNAGTFVLYNLIPNHINRWVLLNDEMETVSVGRIRATGQIRMIYTEKLHNFRDIGGWECSGGRIEYGKIIRGGEANGVYNVQASPEDIVRLRNLGIRQEVDMRGKSETNKDDDDPTNDIDSSELGEDVYYDWFPNSVGTSMLTPGTTQYEMFVDELSLILDRAVHNLPTYLHCQGGADRTGVTALMIEALLGVSLSDVSKDYELTSLFTVAGGMVGRYITDERWVNILTILNSQNGETLQDKVESWFLTAGFTQSEISEFRTAMVEAQSEVVPVTGITISASANSVPVGETLTLIANVIPVNATTPISWASSNNSVATVFSGIVSAISEGSVTITASADGVSATYSVTVSAREQPENLLAIDGRTKGTGNSVIWSEDYFWYQISRNGILAQREMPSDSVVSNDRICGTLHSAYQGIGFPVQLEVGKSYKVNYTKVVSKEQIGIGFFDSSGTCLSHSVANTFTVPTGAVWTLVVFATEVRDAFVDFTGITLTEVI